MEKIVHSISFGEQSINTINIEKSINTTSICKRIRTIYLKKYINTYPHNMNTEEFTISLNSII
jgi:hypothetical protein